MAKPNIRDIAARANVSPATVSNALNGKGGVSKAVAQQIVAIAKEIGYPMQPSRQQEHAHPYVRLVVFKSHGMVIMDTMFFAELIEYVQEACEQEGLELVITHVNAYRDADYAQRVQEIAGDDCCGILLLGTEMRVQELAMFQRCKAPLVVLDNACSFEPMHSVVMDNRGAAYLGVKALYDAGHRRIDHVSSNIRFRNTEERQEGYFNALRQLGLPTETARVWHVTPSIDGAYQDMKRLLAEERQEMPTAIFAANDLMAIGCMRALTEAGYRIPEDLSVMGMDDTSVCLACTPQLSTVHVYRRQLAMTAIRMLLHVVPDTHEGYTQALVSVSAVMRDSVRALAIP